MASAELGSNAKAQDGKVVGGLQDKAWARLTGALRKTPRIRALIDIGRMALQLRGGMRVHCNVCSNNVRLLPFGMPMRNNAMCPKCGSLERHRLLLKYFEQHPELLSEAEILHFAPEESIESFIRANGPQNYRTADIEPGRADLQLSIEQTGLPSESLDLIIANHVLEHVDDDKALSELWRILKPGGRALLMVPIIEGWKETYENPAIATARDRNDHFGQADHVRRYGRDLRDRITQKNFDLQEFSGTHAEAFEFGFLLGEVVFVAHKPS